MPEFLDPRPSWNALYGGAAPAQGLLAPSPAAAPRAGQDLLTPSDPMWRPIMEGFGQTGAPAPRMTGVVPANWPSAPQYGPPAPSPSQTRVPRAQPLGSAAQQSTLSHLAVERGDQLYNMPPSPAPPLNSEAIRSTTGHLGRESGTGATFWPVGPDWGPPTPPAPPAVSGGPYVPGIYPYGDSPGPGGGGGGGGGGGPGGGGGGGGPGGPAPRMPPQLGGPGATPPMPGGWIPNAQGWMNMPWFLPRGGSSPFALPAPASPPLSLPAPSMLPRLAGPTPMLGLPAPSMLPRLAGPTPMLGLPAPSGLSAVGAGLGDLAPLAELLPLL